MHEKHFSIGIIAAAAIAAGIFLFYVWSGLEQKKPPVPSESAVAGVQPGESVKPKVTPVTLAEGFPKDLILDPQAALAASQKYRETNLDRIGTTYKSVKTFAELRDAYRAYFKKNGWELQSEDERENQWHALAVQKSVPPWSAQVNVIGMGGAETLVAIEVYRPSTK